MQHRVILDLCSGTGAWSDPYREAGYNVQPVDLPHDVRLLEDVPPDIWGVLAASPCTVFSYARNRYPASEDELREALSVVDACLRVVYRCKPKWWALENPRNKLRRFLGLPRFTFYQWEFGNAAHKPTCLWGDFTIPKRKPGLRTKASTFKTSRQNADPEDAITPEGFARAFFEANP